MIGGMGAAGNLGLHDDGAGTVRVTCGVVCRRGAAVRGGAGVRQCGGVSMKTVRRCGGVAVRR